MKYLLLLISYFSFNSGWAQIKITVNPEKGLKKISPYLYGRNNSFSSTNPTAQLSPADLTRIKDAGVKFFRENGGNNSSKYNWRKKLSSHPDWYNNVYTNDWDNVIRNISKNFPGSQSMFGFQLIGWAASRSQYNFNDWNYNRSQWWEGVAQNLAGNGVLNPSGTKAKTEGDPKLYLEKWPADSTTGILDHWFEDLKINKQHAGYWNMDNEPEIWNGTHDDVMPTLIKAEEFIDRYIATAISARKRFPEIKLVGPVTANEWQWYNWNNDAIAFQGKKYPWLEYFIMRLAQEQKSLGINLLDVLDIHFYPSTSKPSEIAQLHRVFFDRNYVFPEANGVRRINGGWDTSQNKEYIFGRVNDWLDLYFGPNHGITLGLTESGINTDDANLSAIWYASTLGEFMKNGVEIFTPWSWKPGMWEVLSACSNHQQKYYFSANSTDEEKVSVYPAINAGADSVTLLIVNKTSESQNTSIGFEHFIADQPIQLLRIQDLPATETYISGSQNALKKESLGLVNNRLNLTLKPYSVTLALLNGKKGEFQETTLGTLHSEELIIFPNPAKRELYLKNIKESVKSVEIINVRGQSVSTLITENNKCNIPDRIEPGVFSLKINTGNTTIFKKLIINSE